MDDFLLFKNYFEKFLPVEDDELIEIASVFEPLEVQSAEVFLPEGTVDRYIYLLWEGIVRLFYSTENKDISLMFFRKTGIFSSFISFSREVPSPVSLQAITNVLLLRARKNALEDLYQKN